MIERLRLRTGIKADHAIETLNDLAGKLGNSITVTTPPPERAIRVRDAYLDVVEYAELRLANLTADIKTLCMFETDRYWHIRNLDEDSARPEPLVRAEIERQVEALKRMRHDLEERARRAAMAPGRMVVLDTNLLLEYMPPGQINWLDVLGASAASGDHAAVRLIVPLRVIEELDAKKYARRADVADRARRMLAQLDKVLGTDGAPGQLNERVTIEVPVDPGPRRRPADADEEVLETCEELRQLTGQMVTLVTADTAMRVRAAGRSIPVVQVPEKYKRVRDRDAANAHTAAIAVDR